MRQVTAGALLPISMAAALSACASGKAVFNSKTDLEGAAPVSRALVIARINSRSFNKSVQEGFDQALVEGLSSCGLAARIIHPDPMELEFEKRAETEFATFKPEAALLIRSVGGNITIGNGGTHGDLNFEFKLIDVKSGKTTWFARSQFRLLTDNMFSDDAATGKRLAALTLTQLQADHVLTGCAASPAGAKPSPGPAEVVKAAEPESRTQPPAAPEQTPEKDPGLPKAWREKPGGPPHP